MFKKYFLLGIPIILTVFLLSALVESVSQAAQFTTQLTPTANKVSTLPGQDEKNRLHPDLVKVLSSRENIEQLPIIIEWEGQSYQEVINASLSRLDQKQSTRILQRGQVVADLQTYASEQSSALRTSLQAAEELGQASDIQSYWVSPIIALKADPDLIEALSKREDVVQIRLDERIYLEQTDFQTQDSTSGYPWNLELIGVDLAEQQLGLDGSGVVVANLDTGVDWQHPALQKKYRGYNPHGPAQHIGNWYVVTNEPYQVPGDGTGHGTHTMGTMVGDDAVGNRTGVAPGARWIAVKLFDNQGYTYESWIHAAFQWVLAPEGNPSLAPDIVNCSWGADNGQDVRFRADIVALRSGGILPVFSAGNNGPSAYTIGSPASFPESFSVGAIDQDRYTALFSSRGPSPWNEIKPEVSAPGANILSTFPGSGYAAANGTSMAAPHVSGLAALLLQADPSLNPDELEELIMTTADPLGSVHPNNDTGWGSINAYAAGLKVTSHGELVGFVRQSGNNSPVSFPLMTAKPLDNPDQTLKTIGNNDGSFTFALRPGRYDLSVSAFGFFSDTLHNIGIFTGTQTSLDIALSDMPTGFLSGKITDLESSLPLSATLTVEGTPVRTQSNPATGFYSLSLPEGTWKIKITSFAYHTGHITPTITAGASYTENLSLLPAPKILLVDAGRWYNGSQISYFKDALDALDLTYREWPIRSLGLGNTPDERPSKNDFAPYDIVIWSDPSSSPGWIGSNDVISGYLRTGGHLLISGEDTLYLDGGGTIYSMPASYMIQDIGIQFKGEGNLTPLTGVQGSFFEGLQLSLNTPDSSQQQLLPDDAQIRFPLQTQASLAWSNQAVGSVAAGFCKPYRAFWTGFGLEGVGPRSQRIGLLERVFQWFEETPPPYGIEIDTSPAPLIASPGSLVTQTVQINHTGVLTDVFNLHVAGGTWPLNIELPDGQHTAGDASFSLGSCQGTVITATITIPSGQPRDAKSIYRLEFTSQNDPTIQEAVTLTAKTHAPVLLVEHQIWYKNIMPYTQTLSALGIPYDIFHTQSPAKTPSYSVLTNYPIVIWTSGYNWYSPLGNGGEQQLTQYLDAGGRLLLSSQDLLDVNGLSHFIQDRLGVIGFTLSVTPTEVTGSQQQSFHSDLGLWNLTFPYTNWGDGLTPSDPTAVVLLDQNPFPVGVVHGAGNWRSSFFSFPLENLDASAHHTLLSQALLWISPFGESRLDAPPAASSGSRIPITLTLALANAQPNHDLRAELDLLPQTSLVPGSLQGDWEYDPLGNNLVWNGALSTTEKVVLKAELQLAGNIPAGTILSLRAKLYDGKGLVVTAEAPVQVDLPWLRLSGTHFPREASLGDTIAYTLTLENDGVMPDPVTLTITLPTGIRFIPGSLSASQGTATPSGSIIYWSGEIQPQAQVSVQFNGLVMPAHPGMNLAASAQAVDSYTRRKAWFVVTVPAHYYYPIIAK